MAMPDPASDATETPVAKDAPRRRPWLSPLNQRRWRNFTRNRRAYWSLIIFSGLFGLSLMAEFIANDKPILVSYRGEIYMPIFNFYPETEFGGDLPIEAQYQYEDVECLIRTGGIEACYDDPEGIIAEVEDSRFHLLEALAGRIYEVVREEADVEAVEVVVEKPHALRFADSVAVRVADDA